jgi:outer membrane putative beta-barrel porin/alpha-amylase
VVDHLVPRRVIRVIVGCAVCASALLPAGRAWAGPPFLTDDPEPVELGHWEIYGATQWSWARHAASGTLPHVEANYGALPGLQLHAVVPAVLSWNQGEPLQYGLGDVELGAKLRFVEEGDASPQIGIFPLATLPTGSSSRGLGAGRVQALLPVWLQKSFGPWTTYGGGGVRLAADGNAAVVGWLLQRALSGRVTLGVEAYLTIPFKGYPVQTQVNAGLIVDFSERHHLLLSAGPSFGTDVRAQTYLAYLLTLSPAPPGRPGTDAAP